MSDTEQPESASAAKNLLFVDDEPSILSALRRLFRPHGYHIFVAEGGAAALQILEKEKIDLVISDMRMPEMDGARFLEQVRARWPDVIRILLTGYADITSTIAAINRGEIYRYISKPWEDNDIILIVQEAFRRQQLEQENARLLELTRRQNEELKALNSGLEAKVLERTQEVRQTMSFLDLAHQNLKKSFINTVRVLSGFLDMRSLALGGHARRVADHARSVAQRLSLDDNAVQAVFFAALLHDIGKIGWHDGLLVKPFNALSPDERAVVVKHPVIAEQLLMGVESLAEAARIVRHHHERFDGAGFPDQLAGLAIPIGARIVAVVNDYDALLLGTLVNRRLNPDEARSFLLDNRAKRYDPGVIDAFEAILSGVKRVEPDELAVKALHLKPGMVIARDVMHPDGYLLLSAGHVLQDTVIDQLLKIEASGQPLRMFIRRPAAVAP